MTASVVAEQAYRYWTFWIVDQGQWAFSQLGPASTLPPDGAVQGWRFAVTTSAGNSLASPRTDPASAFDRACGRVDAVAGAKRVAIVIDAGDRDTAPSGQSPPSPRAACAVVEVDATGAKALASVADLRIRDGLVCGIDNYPAHECAVTVPGVGSPPSTAREPSVDVLAAAPTASTAAASSPPGDIGSPVGAALTALLLVVGLAVAWWLQRRRLRGSSSRGLRP